mgnify:CR=1 FL=1
MPGKDDLVADRDASVRMRAECDGAGPRTGRKIPERFDETLEWQNTPPWNVFTEGNKVMFGIARQDRAVRRDGKHRISVHRSGGCNFPLGTARQQDRGIRQKPAKYDAGPCVFCKKTRPGCFGPKQDIVFARARRKSQKLQDVGFPGSFIPLGVLRDVRLHDADLSAALRRGIGQGQARKAETSAKTASKAMPIMTQA